RRVLFRSLLQGLADEGEFLRIEQRKVGPGQRTGRVDGEPILRIVIVQRNRDLAAAALGRMLSLAIVPRAVERNAEKPGLKLAVALERVEAFDDRQENVLANFLHVLTREIESELKDKAASGGIVAVDELVPCLGLALAAASQQLSFTLETHDTQSKEPTGICQLLPKESRGPEFARRYRAAKKARGRIPETSREDTNCDHRL